MINSGATARNSIGDDLYNEYHKQRVSESFIDIIWARPYTTNWLRQVRTQDPENECGVQKLMYMYVKSLQTWTHWGLETQYNETDFGLNITKVMACSECCLKAKPILTSR